jgi:hypothetical protein
MKSFSFILHPLAPLRVRRSVAFILFFGSPIFSQDLTVSKDSIQIYNNLYSSYADEVVFTSHSSTPIHLDSAFVLIAEMDTVGFTWSFAQKKMQVEWKGNYGSTQLYLWKMDSVGPDKYKLIEQEFRPPTDTPLSFSGTGTTSRMFFLQIGFCFVCDRTPAYPKYLRGTMRLYFSNGQVMELKLWSNDLRTGVKPKGFREHYSSFSPHPLAFSYRYLANGRRVVANNRALLRENQISRTKLYEKRN